MPFLSCNGVQIHYEVVGKGEPIIFTHGASWDLNSWAPQVEFFAKTNQVISWDVRGHGLSSLPDGVVDGEDFARDLIALLDHLKIKKAVLCGHSMGGHITLRAAINYPERVKKIILIGAIFTENFGILQTIVMPINMISLRLMPMSWIAKGMELALSKSHRAYIKTVLAKMTHERFMRLWRALMKMDSKAELSKISCPALIMFGDKDYFLKAQQYYMAEQISDSKLVEIKNATHATNLDRPDDVNAEIKKFLADN